MNSLIKRCPDSSGSGRWFDMPQDKRRLPSGEMGPSECTTCSGWGLIPTDAGRPMFAMILALRQSPKWR